MESSRSPRRCARRVTPSTRPTTTTGGCSPRSTRASRTVTRSASPSSRTARSRPPQSLPNDLVYAGFSLGTGPAQLLAQTRPGARGALLMSGCLPSAVFETPWPTDVALAVHTTEHDPWVDLDVARGWSPRRVAHSSCTRARHISSPTRRAPTSTPHSPPDSKPRCSSGCERSTGRRARLRAPRRSARCAASARPCLLCGIRWWRSGEVAKWRTFPPRRPGPQREDRAFAVLCSSPRGHDGALTEPRGALSGGERAPGR